ncbi:MAG: nucleotidyltransferase family protein [Pseudomonadota bacterium]
MHFTQPDLLVESVLKKSAFHIQCLETARDFLLPDWAIGAGFVRNVVWDHLHGFETMTPLQDVDVLYFDPDDISKDRETDLEKQFQKAMPGVPWSVRNQARMHLRNGDKPYKGTEDALRFWLETPTCVAVRLNRDDTISVIAPHGFEDLMSMRVRPTPSGKAKFDHYTNRVQAKNWGAIWPNLEVDL